MGIMAEVLYRRRQLVAAAVEDKGPAGTPGP
jgi:hypothetical protein